MNDKNMGVTVCVPPIHCGRQLRARKAAEEIFNVVPFRCDGWKDGVAEIIARHFEEGEE